MQWNTLFGVGVLETFLATCWRDSQWLPRFQALFNDPCSCVTYCWHNNVLCRLFQVLSGSHMCMKLFFCCFGARPKSVKSFLEETFKMMSFSCLVLNLALHMPMVVQVCSVAELEKATHILWVHLETWGVCVIAHSRGIGESGNFGAFPRTLRGFQEVPSRVFDRFYQFRTLSWQKLALRADLKNFDRWKIVGKFGTCSDWKNIHWLSVMEMTQW